MASKKTGLSSQMTRMKVSPTNFNQGKVGVRNTAKGNGGVAGSGRAPSSPVRFGKETANRSNPLGTPGKPASLPMGKGNKASGKSRKLLG